MSLKLSNELRTFVIMYSSIMEGGMGREFSPKALFPWGFEHLNIGGNLSEKERFLDWLIVFASKIMPFSERNVSAEFDD